MCFYSAGATFTLFYVDPLAINWHRYLELFAYGMTKFYLGEDVVPVASRAATETYALSLGRGADELYIDWDRERKRPVLPGLFHDAVWAYSKSVRRLDVCCVYVYACSALLWVALLVPHLDSSPFQMHSDQMDL